MILKDECPGCRRYMSTGDFHHSIREWNNYHNGKEHNDYKTREEMKETLGMMKDVWSKSQELNKREEENSNIPDWKIKKILSKRI